MSLKERPVQFVAVAISIILLDYLAQVFLMDESN